MTRTTVGVLAALVLLAAVPIDGEQLLPWNRVKLRTFTAGDFTMAYPEGDGWRQANVRSAEVLMIVTKPPDIQVVVSRSRLEHPVPQADEKLFRLFTEVEADIVKAETPEATEIKSEAVSHPTLGRVVRIDYMRPGSATGRPAVTERVERYSVPAGPVLYRIVFSASPKEFEKEAARFSSMIDSVRLDKPAGQDEEP